MFFFFFLVNELELSIGPPPQKKTNIQIKIKGSTGLSVFYNCKISYLYAL